MAKRKPCAVPLCPALRTKGSYVCAAHAKESKPRNGHKFHAQPTTIGDIRFDSKAEAKRWQELQLLEKAGTIRNLARQPVFPLHAAPVQRTDLPAKLSASDLSPVLVGEYRGDFIYLQGGAMVVEDVKSTATMTPMYRWKKRHLLAQYGIRIVEVYAAR